MKFNKKLLLLGALLLTFGACNKHDSHDHEKDHEHKEEMGHGHSKHEDGEHKAVGGHEDHDDHEEDEHDHDHGHGEEEEKGSDEFEVSAKAFETFELKFKDFPSQNKDGFFVPKSALFYNLDEVALYRLRDNKFKRIHFNKVKKEGERTFINSEELANGDQVVLEGVGFLRMVELANSGGLDHGHSH